jgi:hypothetical protein
LIYGYVGVLVESDLHLSGEESVPLWEPGHAVLAASHLASVFHMALKTHPTTRFIYSNFHDVFS